MSNRPVEIHEAAQAIGPATAILPHPNDPDRWHYRFEVYPGFHDPEDFRELVQGCHEATIIRARQLTDDAASNHVTRHAEHHHPWCYYCEIRAERFEAEHPTRADAKAMLYLAGIDPGDQVCAEMLAMRQAYNARCAANEFYDLNDEDVAALPPVLDVGGLPPRPYESIVERWPDHVSDQVRDLTEDQYKAIRDFVLWSTFEDHPVTIINAQATTLRRAARYLVLHGKAPVDPWPNIEDTDYDAEFLTRDQLDDLPESDDLIAGIIPRNSYGILRGRDHSFKTFVAIDWACHIAAGLDWCGRGAASGKVLYIVGEGAHGIAKRIAAWEADHGVRIPDDRFVVRTSALNLFKPTPALDHLLAYVEAGGFTYVVIDTLRRVSGGADGNGSDMGVVVDNIERIKRATDQGTVHAMSHTDKADTDSRGFSGIEDDADFVWHAKRDDMVVEVTCTKMKDGPDGHSVRLQARKVGESLALVEAGETVRVGVSESATKLLNEFFTTFRDGASQAALRDGCGLSKSTYYRAIAELVEAGHVINTGSKHRPFYERVEPDSDQ